MQITRDHPPPHAHQVITLHAVATPTRKRRGEASEAAFLARATNLGFSVCIPWGDSERYDSVISRGPRLLRVQVKSASRYAETRYRVRTTGASYTIYTPAEIDFFVAHIVPEDLWYIIPIEAVGHRKGIRFYPHTRHPSRAGCPILCVLCKGWDSTKSQFLGFLITSDTTGLASS